MSTLPYVWIYEFAHQFHVVGIVFNRRFPVDFHHLEKETIQNHEVTTPSVRNFFISKMYIYK